MTELSRNRQNANYASDVVSVTDFLNADGSRVVGDGVTDCTTGIQAALDSGSSVYFPNGTYNISDSLNIDVATSTMIGDGVAKIVLTDTSKTALVLSNSITDANKKGMQAIVCDGIYFQCSGKASGTSKFCYINDSVTSSIWGCTFSNGGIYGFVTGVDFGDGVFGTTFNNFHFNSNGTCISNLGGTSNSGERQSFSGCFFANNDLILNQTNGNSSVVFTNCSLDYSAKAMTITAGTVLINSCHIEDNTTANNWFTITGANTTLRVSNSVIILNIDSSTSYSIFDSNSTVTLGGIYVSDCSIWTKPGLVIPSIISGTGCSAMSNITFPDAVPLVPMSEFQNLMAYGDMESANWANDYSALTGTIPPTQSSTHANNGTYSLEMTGVPGVASRADIIRPIKAGRMVTGSYYYKTDVATNGATFYVTANFLDAAGGSLFGAALKTVTTDVDWTYTTLQMARRAPAGTESIRIRFEVFGASGANAQAWVDDILITTDE